MTKYTIVIDYMGGTYLRQLEAASIDECQARVHEVMDWDALAPVPTERAIDFGEDNTPSPIKGLTNVWCLSGFIDEEVVLIHVVATAE